jgi:hypothetical protein
MSEKYQSGYEAGYSDGYKRSRAKGFRQALQIIRNEYMLEEAGYGCPTYNRYEEIFLALINAQESDSK